MPDITDLTPYLNQVGIDPTQGNNTTTLPNMPGQGFTPPGVNLPQEPPVTTPDQFEQDIIQRLQKLQNGGPAAIAEQKRQEYYKNLGIKPGKEKSFGGILMRAMKEYGASSDAQKAGTPYLSPSERFQQQAQQEYEKQYPLLKGEVQEIMRNRRADTRAAQIEAKTAADNATKEKIAAGIKATKDEANRLNGLDIMRKIDSAKYTDTYHEELAKKLAAETKDLENGPSKNDSPVIKTYKAAQKIAEQTGRPFADIMKDISDISVATKPANSDLGIIKRDNPTENALELYKKKENSKQVKPNIFMMPAQVRDASGNLSQTYIPENKNALATGQPIQVPEGTFAGNNPERLRVDRAFEQTNNNASAALGVALNDIRAAALGNKDSIRKWTGPVNGNPISSDLRAWGVTGDTQGRNAGETLLDTLRGTAAYNHVHAQLGTTRPSQKVIEENEKNIGTKVHTAEDLARGLGSIRYTAQMGKNGNNGSLKPEELGPEHSKAMQNELEKAINIAKNPMAGPVVLPKHFNQIQKEVKERKILVPQGTSNQDLLDRHTKKKAAQ